MRRLGVGPETKQFLKSQICRERSHVNPDVKGSKGINIHAHNLSRAPKIATARSTPKTTVWQLRQTCIPQIIHFCRRRTTQRL